MLLFVLPLESSVGTYQAGGGQWHRSYRKTQQGSAVHPSSIQKPLIGQWQRATTPSLSAPRSEQLPVRYQGGDLKTRGHLPSRLAGGEAVAPLLSQNTSGISRARARPNTARLLANGSASLGPCGPRSEQLRALRPTLRGVAGAGVGAGVCGVGVSAASFAGLALAWTRAKRGLELPRAWVPWGPRPAATR